MFDVNHSMGAQSAVDQFIVNTSSINTLYIPYLTAGNLPKELGSLVLLGLVSAAEGYCRAMVRQVINIDAVAMKLVETRTLSFGAALHHTSNMMAEAVLEEISFAGAENIRSVLRDLLGIRGNVPQPLKGLLPEYKKICELRHCCVHRFGSLGAKNAIALGMTSHKSLLEKPFSPTVVDLQNLYDVLRTFIFTLNNVVFANILERTAKNKDDAGQPLYEGDWSWDYRTDRSRFTRYYDAFASTRDVQPSPPAREIYDDFRSAYRP